MSIQILRDLRGLRVLVIHPPDTEGVDLVGHLRRIGCQVDAAWPIPDTMDNADVVVLAIDHESKAPIQRLLRNFVGIPPTMIAVVGYEDPSILQLVLEARAHAVIERPVRPFGLLTQLTVARSLWLERQQAGGHAEHPARQVDPDGGPGTVRGGGAPDDPAQGDAQARADRGHGARDHQRK